MPEPHIRRRRLALGLVVLASVVAFVAMFSVWVNRQVLNTDNWTATSSRLLENTTIRNQIAGFLVDELYANVDVEGEIRTALPPRAQPLAGPAAGALRTFAERGTKEVLARPRAQVAWEAANRNAHELLIKVLEGGGPIVSTQDGTVTLDLKALLEETQARVGLGGRLRERLPADAAELTILRSDQLGLAQDVFRTLRPLPIVLVSLSLLLFAIALVISPGWRRKAVRAYGIGFIAAGALALAAISVLGDTVVGSLARTEAAEPAIAATWTIATTLLDEIAVSTIGYGVLMWLGALLAGPTRIATAIRRLFAPYLREPGFAYGGLLVLLGVGILWWAPTPATRNPVTAVLLAILIAIGFEGLRRQTAREFPDADRRVAEQHGRERLARGAASVRQWAGAATTRNGDSAAPPHDERFAQLEQLGRLHDAGTLDDDEFRAEKQRILSAATP
jgi:putative oligomerization/nucleic acid binding protein